MATLSMQESREYVIFQAFAENKKFGDALKAMEAYDKRHSSVLIFSSVKDKKAMRQSFNVFKEAEGLVSKGGNAPDYDNPIIVERLRTVITQKISPMRAVVLNENAQGIVTRKANIGSILFHYAKDYQKLDARDKQRITREAGRIEHEPAITDRSGIVDHGGFDGNSVFSERSGAGGKSMHQILIEREFAERRKRCS